MHEGVKGGEDAVSLHDIFAPQADLGAALHPVKGDAVDRRGFGVGLVAAVDIGALVAAEDDALAKLATELPKGTYTTVAELVGASHDDVAAVADAIASVSKVEASFDAEYAPSLI